MKTIALVTNNNGAPIFAEVVDERNIYSISEEAEENGFEVEFMEFTGCPFDYDMLAHWDSIVREMYMEEQYTIREYAVRVRLLDLAETFGDFSLDGYYVVNGVGGRSIVHK